MNKIVTLEILGKESFNLFRKIPVVMRLSVVFLFLSLGIAVANNSYAQNTTLSLEMSNSTIANVLEAVENQTDFSFIYDANVVNINKKVSVSVNEKNIFDVLNKMFGNSDIAYTVVNKKIILNKKEAIDLMQQQGKRVTGVVVDKNNEPVIGANILVKGTTNGNISDVDGKVILQNVPNNATLVISYIGYITQEVKVGSLSTINVKLVEDAKTLEEVVVIGYGSLDKKQVTSAITSLKADDLMVGVSGADISASLQGKIGGLVMYNLGSANAGTTFQLRGMTSINSGKSPLIVIDGFPGGDIRSLTQDDIKSIDVLKDGSAGAIYGTRAAAGVILITTKSGSDTNGKVKLTYSNEFTKKQNYNAPEMLSGREYAEHNIGTDYGSDTNWWDEMINKDNFSQKHHLALEMGTEKAQVYTSFFYEKNQLSH